MFWTFIISSLYFSNHELYFSNHELRHCYIVKGHAWQSSHAVVKCGGEISLWEYTGFKIPPLVKSVGCPFLVWQLSETLEALDMDQRGSQSVLLLATERRTHTPHWSPKRHVLHGKVIHCKRPCTIKVYSMSVVVNLFHVSRIITH